MHRILSLLFHRCWMWDMTHTIHRDGSGGRVEFEIKNKQSHQWKTQVILHSAGYACRLNSAFGLAKSVRRSHLLGYDKYLQYAWFHTVRLLAVIWHIPDVLRMSWEMSCVNVCFVIWYFLAISVTSRIMFNMRNIIWEYDQTMVGQMIAKKYQKGQIKVG